MNASVLTNPAAYGIAERSTVGGTIVSVLGNAVQSPDGRMTCEPGCEYCAIERETVAEIADRREARMRERLAAWDADAEATAAATAERMARVQRERDDAQRLAMARQGIADGIAASILANEPGGYRRCTHCAEPVLYSDRHAEWHGAYGGTLNVCPARTGNARGECGHDAIA